MPSPGDVDATRLRGKNAFFRALARKIYEISGLGAVAPGGLHAGVDSGVYGDADTASGSIAQVQIVVGFVCRRGQRFEVAEVAWPTGLGKAFSQPVGSDRQSFEEDRRRYPSAGLGAEVCRRQALHIAEVEEWTQEIVEPGCRRGFETFGDPHGATLQVFTSLFEMGRGVSPVL